MHDAEARRRVKRRNRSVLLGLILVFAAPILIAYALNVWWPHWSPFGRMNHGEIVEPPWAIGVATMGEAAAERTAGRWILLHPIAGRCDDVCEALLDRTRRVHVSLGKDYDRVVRMFAHRTGFPGIPVQATDPDLIPLPVSAAWFDRFGGDEPALLVIDPQRNAVLRYGAGLDGKGLARDLARMLKISKIG